MIVSTFARSLILLMLITLFTVAIAANKNPAQAPLFNNLGNFHYAIATKSKLAQRFFDQGFVLFYGFEWGESIRSFREATRLDPDCTMCYWGLALALGYKGNAPMSGHEYSDARNAIKKALTLAEKGPQKEQHYVNALALRFQHKPQPEKPGSAFSCHASSENPSPIELLNYANAMKKVTTQYPKDSNAKALYAYALFDTIDWKFWDAQGNINKVTPTIIKILDSVLAKDKLHVGANHYYVHVLEQSPYPAKGLSSANRLKKLIPGSEHLVHMPTHIYFLTGRYHEGTDSNLQAIAAYKTYSKLCRAQGFKPQITYLYHHDFDFLRTTAAMEGRQQLALSAARDLLNNLPAAWIKNNPDLQWFIPLPWYVQARFGMWRDLLNETKPDTTYQYALGMWHYVQGMAHIHLNNFKRARNELTALSNIVDKGDTIKSLGKSGHHLLTIAKEVLLAMMANFNGHEKETINHLKTAMKIQHDMGYHEPPDWYFPVKEILADAYLQWHHPKEAKVMYEEDLKQYPENGWALYGLARSLRMLGQDQEAKRMETAFKKAWQYADIPRPINLFERG